MILNSKSGPRLSRRQQQILDFVRQSVEKRGFPPSIREIGEAVGLSSSSTVHSHLRSLETKRYLRRNPSKPRSIELLDPTTGRHERSRLDILQSENDLLRKAIADALHAGGIEPLIGLGPQQPTELNLIPEVKAA